MNVLIISAHPDDEYLGVGGTLIKHLDAGDRVTAVILCEGVTVREHTAMAHQHDCARQAADLIGLRDLRRLDFPDQRLDTMSQVELNAVFEGLIRELQPEIIYTHFWGDINRDHQLMAESLLVAARPKPGCPVRRILMFETPSATEWSPGRPQSAFTPNWFVDINAQLERKLAALACYDTEMLEFPHPRSLVALEHRARHWGSLVGLPAAEPFVLVRQLEP